MTLHPSISLHPPSLLGDGGGDRGVGLRNSSGMLLDRKGRAGTRGGGSAHNGGKVWGRMERA